MTQTAAYALGAIVLTVVLYNIMQKVGNLTYFLLPSLT
jgi:hypothetical protein